MFVIKNIIDCFLCFVMRCFFRMCDFAARGPFAVRDLTGEVINYVMESRIKNGHVLVQAMRGDVGVCLNCMSGFKDGCFCGGLSPFLRQGLSLIVFGGRLQIGDGQRILLGELDGCRLLDEDERGRYAVSIIGA